VEKKVFSFHLALDQMHCERVHKSELVLSHFKIAELKETISVVASNLNLNMGFWVPVEVGGADTTWLYI
jgi:hypothetical protein